MNNPFVFGEIVSDEALCDREEEQKTLTRDLRDSQKIFLISTGRNGNSLQKLPVFFGCSDGNTQGIREVPGAHVSDEDAFLQKPLKNGLCPWRLEEDKVGVRGRDLESCYPLESLIENLSLPDRLIHKR